MVTFAKVWIYLFNPQFKGLGQGLFLVTSSDMAVAATQFSVNLFFCLIGVETVCADQLALVSGLDLSKIFIFFIRTGHFDTKVKKMWIFFSKQLFFSETLLKHHSTFFKPILPFK